MLVLGSNVQIFGSNVQMNALALAELLVLESVLVSEKREDKCSGYIVELLVLEIVLEKRADECSGSR